MVLSIVSILCFRGCDYEEYNLQDFNICSASLVYPSNPENGGHTFIRNVLLSPNYMSIQLKRTIISLTIISYSHLQNKTKKNIVAYYKLTEHVLFNLTP
jgi:hypothetical protein